MIDGLLEGIRDWLLLLKGKLRRLLVLLILLQRLLHLLVLVRRLLLERRIYGTHLDLLILRNLFVSEVELSWGRHFEFFKFGNSLDIHEQEDTFKHKNTVIYGHQEPSISIWTWIIIAIVIIINLIIFIPTVMGSTKLIKDCIAENKIQYKSNFIHDQHTFNNA